MRVLIPSALHSYVGGAWTVAEGTTLAAVLDDLDRRYPGLRFRIIDEQGRIRPHIRFFVAGEQWRDVDRPLPEGSELMIVQALSGG